MNPEKNFDWDGADIEKKYRPGFICNNQKEILNSVQKYINDKSIYSGNNYETTYQTFRYMFDLLKKGVYINIKKCIFNVIYAI